MAVVATIIGILALTAAAHYYYTTYYNDQPTPQYNEPYKPPEYWDPPQRQFHNEENPGDIFSDHENELKVTQQIKQQQTSTNQNDLLNVYKWLHEIISSTTPEDTTFQDTTTPYSTDKPQSTSIELGNDIEYGIGPPHGEDIRKRKSKEYYKFKVKSKAKFEPDRTDLKFVDVSRAGTTEYSISTNESPKYAMEPPQPVDINTLKSKKYYYNTNSETKHNTDRTDVVFVDVNHAEKRDPVMIRNEEKNSEILTTKNSISRNSASTILGNFLKVIIMVIVVLP